MTSAELQFPRLRSVATALPEHYVDQKTLMAAFRAGWEGKGLNPRVIDRLHQAVQVSGRYLSIPMAEYYGLDSFAKSNQAWNRVAPAIGQRAAEDALRQAGLTARDIDHIFFVTVTGIAVPSIDAVLVNRLGMRTDIKRTPIFGLGCVAGAAGIARASDYARAFPGQICMLLSIELCSLTLQKEDLSIANIVASGLFGDGAAAVIIEGGGRADSIGPRVLDSRSVFYPNSEQMMGWEIAPSGFKIVLSAKVPELVRANLRRDVQLISCRPWTESPRRESLDRAHRRPQSARGDRETHWNCRHARLNDPGSRSTIPAICRRRRYCSYSPSCWRTARPSPATTAC